jgi:hypothetical protein
MIQAQYQMLTVTWGALKQAVSKWHDEEDGVTSLEVLIIAAVLLSIAGLLAVMFNEFWTAHKDSIPTT